jgi:hypothetical protein
VNQNVDLSIGQHSARLLRKSRHRGSWPALLDRFMDGGVVRDSKIDRPADAHRQGTLPIRPVASRTVLGKKQMKIGDVSGTNHGCLNRLAARRVTRRDCERCR